MTISRVLLVTTAALVGACSFAMSSAPHQLPDSGGVSCDDTLVYPLVDGFGLVASAGLAGAAFADTRGRECSDHEAIACLFDTAFGSAMLVSATVYAVSTVTGLKRRSGCRARRAEYAARAAPTDGLWVTCKTEQVDGVWRGTYVIENLTGHAIDYELVARLRTSDRSWVSPRTAGNVAAGQSAELVFRPFGVAEIATDCSTDWVSARR